MLSVLVVAVLCVGDVFGVSDGILTTGEKNHLVEVHNDQRRKQGAKNMYKLSWDAGLEAHAQELANKCIWAHTPDDVRQWGENMGMILFPTPSDMDIKSTTNKTNIIVRDGLDLFKSRIEEQDLDSALDFSCVSTQNGHNSSCFLQVVWHDTTKIGCAAKNCLNFQNPPKIINNVWILVCDYFVVGNKPNEVQFEKGEPCSGCEEGDLCDDELCVAT